jgi:hypothetical protein
MKTGKVKLKTTLLLMPDKVSERNIQLLWISKYKKKL